MEHYIPLSVPDNLVTVTKSREALKQFRLLYNNEAATFRSPELKAAIENVLYTSNDILAVLPTGIGKSLLFLIHICTCATDSSCDSPHRFIG